MFYKHMVLFLIYVKSFYESFHGNSKKIFVSVINPDSVLIKHKKTFHLAIRE